MKKPKKEYYSTIMGIIFIVYAITAFTIYYRTDSTNFILWLCNHTSLIIGFAFLFRKWFWIGAELNLIFFPQILWSIDFIYRMFTGEFIFGFSDYMFLPSYNKWLYSIGLSHVFMIPIVLVGLFLVVNAVNKKEKESIKKSISHSWKGSLLHLALLMIPSYLLANGTNYNCANSCFTFIPTTLLYKILWPFVVFLIVLLTNYLLNQSLKLIKK